MRLLLAILASVTLLNVRAQTHLPAGPWGLGFSPAYKWQIRPSAGLSARTIFLNGGISYLSAPLSLNLYHPLNNNVTAFAGVSVTPTVLSFGSLYVPQGVNPAYPGSNFQGRYDLGINPAVQGGLIYTNDAHTFSISGSVWMQQGSYPVYPARRPDNSKR